MSDIGEGGSKNSFKENSVVCFNSKDNANIFCCFLSNLGDSILQKLPCPKNKCEIKTTEEWYKQIQNECEGLVLYNVEVTTVDKILKNTDAVKPSGIDLISTKFLKDCASVIAIHLANIINLSIKLETISLKCKSNLFSKRESTGAENYRPISLLQLILKVIEK